MMKIFGFEIKTQRSGPEYWFKRCIYEYRRICIGNVDWYAEWIYNNVPGEIMIDVCKMVGDKLRKEKIKKEIRSREIKNLEDRILKFSEKR